MTVTVCSRVLSGYKHLCKFTIVKQTTPTTSSNYRIFCSDARRLIRSYPFSVRLSSSKLIDGKAIAKEIKDEVKAEVQKLKDAGMRPPQLTVLLVGDNPASTVYVANKIKAAQYTGIESNTVRLPVSITEQELLAEIQLMNNAPSVDGLLVQLPVPDHIRERVVCDAVAPQKDVDGFHILNIGRCCVDEKSFMPATPAAVLEIIRRSGVETFGKNAVVCGRSKNVGLPIAIFLHGDASHGNSGGDATTTICHRHTPPEQLRLFTKSADIVITATGVPKLITADMVKEGVVIIDVGITRVPHPHDPGKTVLVGDVDFEGVSKKASLITPVPGGVGPVTVAMLMKNTLLAYTKEIKFPLHF